MAEFCSREDAAGHFPAVSRAVVLLRGGRFGPAGGRAGDCILSETGRDDRRYRGDNWGETLLRRVEPDAIVLLVGSCGRLVAELVFQS